MTDCGYEKCVAIGEITRSLFSSAKAISPDNSTRNHYTRLSDCHVTIITNSSFNDQTKPK